MAEPCTLMHFRLTASGLARHVHALAAILTHAADTEFSAAGNGDVGAAAAARHVRREGRGHRSAIAAGRGRSSGRAAIECVGFLRGIGVFPWSLAARGPAATDGAERRRGGARAITRLPCRGTQAGFDPLHFFRAVAIVHLVACVCPDRDEERSRRRRQELRRNLDHHSKQGDRAARIRGIRQVLPQMQLEQEAAPWAR